MSTSSSKGLGRGWGWQSDRKAPPASVTKQIHFFPRMCIQNVAQVICSACSNEATHASFKSPEEKSETHQQQSTSTSVFRQSGIAWKCYRQSESIFCRTSVRIFSTTTSGNHAKMIASFQSKQRLSSGPGPRGRASDTNSGTAGAKVTFGWSTVASQNLPLTIV